MGKTSHTSVATNRGVSLKPELGIFGGISIIVGIMIGNVYVCLISI